MEQSHLPDFCSMIRGATGGGEVWSHTDEKLKMKQYGWRCTTNENVYGTGTLIGNYNEERFDLKEVKKNKPLSSQFDHYYKTSYAEAYNTDPVRQHPQDLKLFKGRLAHAYSCHQPELDAPSARVQNGTWQTTQRASFLDPQLRRQPIKGKPDEKFTCKSFEEAV